MLKNSVFCIALSRNQAEQIVDRLKIERFSNNDISVLFPDQAIMRDPAVEKNTQAPDGVVGDAGAGGVMDGASEWIAGIGAVAIPGAGPFIAAGPIKDSLSGVAASAYAGGIAGGLISLGIPEFEARRYESKLKAGNILIAVCTEEAGDTTRAKDIFRQAGAQSIFASGETFFTPASHPPATERGPRPFEISRA